MPKSPGSFSSAQWKRACHVFLGEIRRSKWQLSLAHEGLCNPASKMKSAYVEAKRALSSCGSPLPQTTLPIEKCTCAHTASTCTHSTYLHAYTAHTCTHSNTYAHHTRTHTAHSTHMDTQHTQHTHVHTAYTAHTGTCAHMHTQAHNTCTHTPHMWAPMHTRSLGQTLCTREHVCQAVGNPSLLVTSPDHHGSPVR